jgi:hypothetical protein
MSWGNAGRVPRLRYGKHRKASDYGPFYDALEWPQEEAEEVLSEEEALEASEKAELLGEWLEGYWEEIGGRGGEVEGWYQVGGVKRQVYGEALNLEERAERIERKRRALSEELGCNRFKMRNGQDVLRSVARCPLRLGWKPAGRGRRVLLRILEPRFLHRVGRDCRSYLVSKIRCPVEKFRLRGTRSLLQVYGPVLYYRGGACKGGSRAAQPLHRCRCFYGMPRKRKFLEVAEAVLWWQDSKCIVSRTAVPLSKCVCPGGSFGAEARGSLLEIEAPFYGTRYFWGYRTGEVILDKEEGR